MLWVPIGYNISYDRAEISPGAFTYDGKVHTPQVTSVTLGSGMVFEEDNYNLAYTDKNGKEVKPLGAGQYYVRISAKGATSEYSPDYYGSINKPFTINKAANTLAAKGKTAKVKATKLKKKAQKLGVSKVVQFARAGQGAKTFKKISGNKKITINKKTGKVTVGKGLKKSTYKVTVKIKAAGDKNHKASAMQKVTFKVKVV